MSAIRITHKWWLCKNSGVPADCPPMQREELVEHRLRAPIPARGDRSRLIGALEDEIATMRVHDKMRDDGERHLLAEVEARDAHIAALREAGDGLIPAMLRSRPLGEDGGWIIGGPRFEAALARWKAARGDSGAGGALPAAPETIAGVPLDELYQGLAERFWGRYRSRLP